MADKAYNGTWNIADRAYRETWLTRLDQSMPDESYVGLCPTKPGVAWPMRLARSLADDNYGRKEHMVYHNLRDIWQNAEHDRQWLW